MFGQFGGPPFPPPPPGPGSPPGGPPGCPGRAFWDFINSFDPNAQQTGQGVDHTDYTDPQLSFPFGPGGAGPPWAGRHGIGGPPWARRGRGGWGPAAWARESNPAGGHHGRGRHWCGRRGHGLGSRDETSGAEEDLYDITTAAAAAEAGVEFSSTGEDAEKDAEKDGEKADSPNTMRDATEEHPDPPEEIPGVWPSFGPGHRGCRGKRGGPFWGRGRGGRRGESRDRPHHPFPFSFGGSPHVGAPPNVGGFADMARRARDYFESLRAQMQSGGNDDGSGSESFTPPLDIFNTHNNWTLHLAVPGAKKEDIGVHWDADRATLTVSGVVHRPGDEEFLGGMVSGERRVGLFERKIELPPAEGNENKDEVDGDHITAKMEDGVLIVVIPKLEKEWTDIKKVDIE